MSKCMILLFAQQVTNTRIAERITYALRVRFCGTDLHYISEASRRIPPFTFCIKKARRSPVGTVKAMGDRRSGFFISRK